MGFASKTVNINQFQVAGAEEFSPDRIIEVVGKGLTQSAFKPIDESCEELSLGWVQLEDMESSDFTNINDYQRGHYLFFSLRRDQRKVSGAVLKRHMEQAIEQFLAEHPGLKRVPKQKREEMKEAVKGSLLAKTFPVPSTYDIVWDLRTHTVHLFTFSPKIVDLVQSLFQASFGGLRIVPVHPFARARKLAGDDLQDALTAANKASSDAVLDLIRENQWIGHDFLAWLLYQTTNESSEYKVSSAQWSLEVGESFVAYLNDKLALVGAGVDGMQKVSVTGPQDRFQEVVAGLNGGKNISEAVIHLEHGEYSWRVALKGETFHLAGFRTPSVLIEKDPAEDEAAEKQAFFFEKMYVIEAGIQMLDSLFKEFLEVRLSPSWGAVDERIRSWAQENAA